MPKCPLPNVKMNQFSLSWEINSGRDTGQYWGKSTFDFSRIVSPCHVSNSLETSFQMERNPICSHIKAFSKAVSKCLMGTYASEESANQWKHHVINEGKVIQTNQYLTQYFQRQTKLQQISPYSWIGLVQQVHLVNRNHQSMLNQVTSLMSKVLLIISIISQNRLFIQVYGIKQHPLDIVFKDCESLTHDSSWKEFNCHVDNKLFSHRHKLFVLQMEETGHRSKKCHGQHHQGHHLQVIDRMYWYIIRSRWKER